MAAPEPNSQDSWGRLWRQIGEYTGLALLLPACGFIGYLIGAALDQHWHTAPVFTLVFLGLGCAAGLIEVVRVAGKD